MIPMMHFVARLEDTVRAIKNQTCPAFILYLRRGFQSIRVPSPMPGLPGSVASCGGAEVGREAALRLRVTHAARHAGTRCCNPQRVALCSAPFVFFSSSFHLVHPFRLRAVTIAHCLHFCIAYRPLTTVHQTPTECPSVDALNPIAAALAA